MVAIWWEWPIDFNLIMTINLIFFFFFYKFRLRLLTYVMQNTSCDLIELKLNMNNHSLDDCFPKNFPCGSKIYDGHTWPCWKNIFTQLDCTKNMLKNLLCHSLSIWKQKNKSGWKYFNMDFSLQKIIFFIFVLIWNLQDNSIGF